jgi:hypothetical protein
MSNDFPHNSNLHHINPTLDFDCIWPETITDTGEFARDLIPVGDCLLTPGDPVPLGRTEDGELAYPEYPTRTTLSISRKDAAKLAHMLAAAQQITEAPEPPFKPGTSDLLLMSLLNAALPSAFYPDSAHGNLARKSDILSVLKGDLQVMDRKNPDQ